MGDSLIEVAVDWEALKKAATLLSGFSDRLLQALEEGVMELAVEIEREAKQQLKSQGAIDQGQLWNSMTVVPLSKTEAIVGTNVSYAAAVEFGSRGHWLHIASTPGFRNWLTRHGIDKEQSREFFYVEPKPRPYMEPAYETGRKRTGEIFQEKIDRVMRRIETT